MSSEKSFTEELESFFEEHVPCECEPEHGITCYWCRETDKLLKRTSVLENTQPIADERDELREVLEEVIAYREGRKPFDFRRPQSESERDNAAFDAWMNIEQRIRAILARYNPKP